MKVVNTGTVYRSVPLVVFIITGIIYSSAPVVLAVVTGTHYSKVLALHSIVFPRWTRQYWHFVQ